MKKMKKLTITRSGRSFEVEYAREHSQIVIMSIDGRPRTKIPGHMLNQMEDWVIEELESEREFIEECRVNELVDAERGLGW